MNDVLCTTHPNGSPMQAFRAGLREGSKMSLDEGRRITREKFKEKITGANLQRLLIWCSVGADVDNGLWAIYGARLGCFMNIMDLDWDFGLIRDYDWFQLFWDKHKDKNPNKEIKELGDILRFRLHIDVAELSIEQSKFFKAIYNNPIRLGLMIPEKKR
jgi:hypothetical protein